ncbi:MAG: hypothetical protein ACRDPF_03050 [Streptosporangiaceae bacterium]
MLTLYASPAGWGGQPSWTATRAAGLTLRFTEGASNIHEAAYWPAEYKPRNCRAAALAAAAVSGWAAGAGVLAAAAGRH